MESSEAITLSKDAQATNELLAKVFSSAICSVFARCKTIDYMDVVILEPQSENCCWSQRITRSSHSIWNLIGMFTQFFVVESNQMGAITLSVINTALQQIVASFKSYLDRMARDFSSFFLAEYVRDELKAYLVISDFFYFERQLNSTKQFVNSTGAGNHVIGELRDFIRSQISAMTSKVIATYSALLSEGLLVDWRNQPNPEGVALIFIKSSFRYEHYFLYVSR